MNGSVSGVPSPAQPGSTAPQDKTEQKTTTASAAALQTAQDADIVNLLDGLFNTTEILARQLGFNSQDIKAVEKVNGNLAMLGGLATWMKSHFDDFAKAQPLSMAEFLEKNYPAGQLTQVKAALTEIGKWQNWPKVPPADPPEPFTAAMWNGQASADGTGNGFKDMFQRDRFKTDVANIGSLVNDKTMTAKKAGELLGYKIAYKMTQDGYGHKAGDAISPEEFDKITKQYQDDHQKWATDKANYDKAKMQYDKDKAKYDQELAKHNKIMDDDDIPYSTKIGERDRWNGIYPHGAPTGPGDPPTEPKAPQLTFDKSEPVSPPVMFNGIQDVVTSANTLSQDVQNKTGQTLKEMAQLFTAIQQQISQAFQTFSGMINKIS
jgi:enamine deaminase RidA (YjgF/YER057c/UK114 family)